jgi:hypothetical protein
MELLIITTISLALIAGFSSLLWMTVQNTGWHIAIASLVAFTATVFGVKFGLSAGFILIAGVSFAEIYICLKSAKALA